MASLVVVDYGAGNLTSVANALSYIGEKPIVSSSPEEILSADRLVFPGVGAARSAMDILNAKGIGNAIAEVVKRGNPVLGICIGCQIILEESEEDGGVKTLGLLPGRAVRFLSEPGIKIPHMGWNNLEHVNGECKILKDVPETSDFYFVHSYVICPEDNSVIKAVADYGIKVPSVVQFNNIYACQFHPEKSGKYGLKILENFCNA